MDPIMPEFAFQDEHLIISTPVKLFRIHGWPSPSARECFQGGAWTDFRPEFRLIKPEASQNILPGGCKIPRSGDYGPEMPEPPDIHSAKQRAFHDFRCQLPHRVAHAVERFQSHQWNLIELLSKDQAAQDLADNNPVLAWCLANNDQFRKFFGQRSPAEFAASRLCKKQREILEWLGFPGTDATVRLMRKILPEAIIPLDARMLRQAVTEPEAAQLLAHLHRVNAGVLGLVCNLKLLHLLSPRLLAEVANSEEEMIRQPTADRLIDATYLLLTAQIHLKVTRFFSTKSICEFHDRVVTEWQRRSQEAGRRRKERRRRRKSSTSRGFPPPPIPGTEDFIPLTSKEELKAEGAQQQNCVGSYSRKVRSGGVCVYKVLSPERATLSIALGPDGFWRRSEIECAGNHPVSWLTKIKVDQWLNKYSLSI